MANEATKIDIKGLSKLGVLKELWSNSKPAAFFAMNGMPSPPFDPSQSPEAVKSYIDYHQGRLIKMDQSGDLVDPRGYDRDYGQGTVQKIVDKLRSH